MTEEKASRRGRSARRDGAAKPHGVPYIVRNIPTYDILSEENLQKIERTADRILAEVGIEFRDDPFAVDHWKRAGAKVDGVLVRFEPGMLREIVSSAPSVFTSTPATLQTASRSGATMSSFRPPKVTAFE